MLKKGIVGAALSNSGEGVVVVVVVVELSLTWLLAELAKPNGLDVTINGFSLWLTFNGRLGGGAGVVVVVVVVEVVEEVVELSRTELLPAELPRPNNFEEVTMMDLKGLPRESRR